MKLGINHTPEHSSPEEWADILVSMGLSACTFPLKWNADYSLIEKYKKAAEDRGIIFAEVGVWNSPNSTDNKEAEAAYIACRESLAIADYIGANCCVNISGAAGPVWNDCYAENYSEAIYERNINIVRRLIDEVKPKRTSYALEVMQWMLPDSAEQYLQFIKDVDREHFAVHMDAVNLVKNPYIYTHLMQETKKAVGLLGKYIRSCHIKDCRIEPALSFIVHEVFPGEGIFDIGAYVDMINGIDSDMPMLIEHLADTEEYKRAIAYVKGICRN